MLAEVSLEEWERSSASKYELFGQIYSQIGENLRKSVRPASAEEREPIIAKYFHQNQRHQYVQELLRENYELSAERSKTDALYLELMAEEYDLAKEEPSFICALLATHNNAFHGQVARTLNSIFNQQYKQYQLVVADAGSSDETLQKIQEYLGRNAEFRERTQVVEVEGSSQALAVLSAAKRCREDSLVVLLDGNTELIGKEVFSIIDSEQRAGKPVVLYSDHYTLDVSAGSLSLFRAQKYDESENFMAIYRSAGAKYGRIVVSKSATLQNIPASHIQHNGRYFEYSGLYSIAASLLELSCGRVKAIAEPLALAVQDSAIAEAEREERRHELALIAMKSKFDVC